MNTGFVNRSLKLHQNIRSYNIYGLDKSIECTRIFIKCFNNDVLFSYLNLSYDSWKVISKYFFIILGCVSLLMVPLMGYWTISLLYNAPNSLQIPLWGLSFCLNLIILPSLIESYSALNPFTDIVHRHGIYRTLENLSKDIVYI